MKSTARQGRPAKARPLNVGRQTFELASAKSEGGNLPDYPAAAGPPSALPRILACSPPLRGIDGFVTMRARPAVWLLACTQRLTKRRRHCPGGETGRHSGLKIRGRLTASCRFESGPGHQKAIVTSGVHTTVHVSYRRHNAKSSTTGRGDESVTPCYCCRIPRPSRRWRRPRKARVGSSHYSGTLWRSPWCHPQDPKSPRRAGRCGRAYRSTLSLGDPTLGCDVGDTYKLVNNNRCGPKGRVTNHGVEAMARKVPPSQIGIAAPK